MKKIILPFFILCSYFSFGQITFQKMYGETGNANGGNYVVQQTRDSGYIVGASIGVCDSCPTYFYLAKTNEYGDTLWTKKYGNTRESNLLSSVQQTFDGGYIIVGQLYLYNNQGGNDLSLIKTNSVGDTLWTKTYNIQGGGDANNYTAKQTNDSGFIIVGAKYISTNNGVDVVLAKIDVNGNLKWTKAYGGTDIDEGYEVQQTKDGGYIVVANTNSFGMFYSVYVIKTGADGNLQWSNTFLSNSNILPSSSIIQETYDGGYAIFVNNGFPILTKMDISGNIQWSKQYLIDLSSPYQYAGGGMQQTKDSGYIIGGVIADSSSNGIPYLYIQKTNINGDTLWNKTFRYQGSSEGLFSIQQTYDDGYILVSIIGSAYYSDNIYIIKTDSNGNSGCNDLGATCVAQPLSKAVINPASLQSSLNSPPDTNTISVINGASSIYTICFSTGIDEIKELSIISLYPNPATNQLTIRTSSFQNEAATVSIMNVLGQTMFSNALSFGEGRGEALDVSKLPSGIYFVQLTSEKERWTSRFVKE